MQLKIQTSRLTMLPFTINICEESLSDSFGTIASMGICPGNGWPDPETLDTLPRIIKNLSKVNQPSGFESWMIVKTSTNLLIGDIGFKGIPNEDGEIDLGYGIITNERKKGFAYEAATGILKWAFNQKKVKSITASCLIYNLGSQKILSLLNFNVIKTDNEMMYWRLVKDTHKA